MPAPNLALTSVTGSSITLAVTNLAADGTLEVQYAVRPDFKNCVCPIAGVARSTPLVLVGVTQDTTYYIRVRSKRASGAYEDWSATLGVKTALDTPPDLTTPAVLISPAILVVPVPVLDWTGDAELPGYPCYNLGFDAPVAWRMNLAGNAASFLARMGPQPVDTVALLMSNASETATVQVRAGNTPATSDYVGVAQPFRASANLANRPGWHGLVRLTVPISYPYWRVTVTMANGLTGPFHLEHAVFGLNRTTKNHSVDKSEAPLDLGAYERSRSGIPQRTLGLRGKRVDFDISMVSQAQFEANYADLPRLVGTTMPVLAVPNSRSGAFLHDRILYGVLTGGKAVNPASPVYSRSFTIDSILP